MADNELGIHVSADTKSARDEFKALGSEAVGTFNAIGEQGKVAGSKLAALDKVWDSPRGLAKAATAAKVELDTLIDDMERAGKVTPAMAKAFDDAGAKIDMASKRAKQFADTAGDLAKKGDIAARGFESVAGSAGSLEGMLGNLNDTGTATQQMIAKVGIASIALTAAFAGGYEAGEKLDQKAKEVGINFENLGRAIVNLAGGGGGEGSGIAKLFSEWGLAMNKVIPIGEANVKVLQDLGEANKQFAGMMDALPTRINPVIAAQRAHTRALEETAAAMKAIDPSFRSYEERQSALTKAVEAWEKRIAAATLAGKDWKKEAELNADGIKKLVDEHEKLNGATAPLPGVLGKVADAAHVAGEAHRKLAEDQKKATEAAEAAVKAHAAQIESLAKLADANDMGRGSIKEYEAGLEALAKARGVSIDAIRAEVEAKKHEIQTHKDSIPVYKNVEEAMAGATRATDAQAAAIRGEIDAINGRALAESRRIGEGKGKTPEQYADELANIDAETAAIQERNRAGDGGNPSEYMDTLIVQRKKETEAYMLLQIAQAKANEDLAKSKDKVTEANDRAAKSEGNFSEALSRAGVLIVSYSETLRGLHGQIVELNDEQNKLIDGLARTAGQYSLTDAESRRLLTTMEHKLELLGKETDWYTNQQRTKAVEEYVTGLQDLIDAWSMMRVDMPNSAVAIADLNTQLADAVRIADQLRKTFGG